MLPLKKKSHCVYVCFPFLQGKARGGRKVKAESHLWLGTKLWVAHLLIEPLSWRPAPGQPCRPRKLSLPRLLFLVSLDLPCPRTATTHRGTQDTWNVCIHTCCKCKIHRLVKTQYKKANVKYLPNNFYIEYMLK